MDMQHRARARSAWYMLKHHQRTFHIHKPEDVVQALEIKIDGDTASAGRPKTAN